MFKNKKAQVSIETLLIIGAVILLAIVFIVFFISNLNRNVEISNKQSEGVDNIFDRFIKDYKEYNKVETFELKLKVDPDGVGKAIGEGSYKKGSVATVEAESALADYVFYAWLDDEENKLSSSLKYSLVMESNKTIIASFKHKDDVEIFSLKITVEPEKSGRVEPEGGTYAKGTNVELLAKPSEGYTFKHWLNSKTEPATILSSSNPYNFTINKDTELVAVFEKKAPSGIPGEIGGPGGGGAETESP